MKDQSNENETEERLMYEVIKGKFTKDQKVIIPFNDTSEKLFNGSYYGTQLPSQEIELDINEAFILMERNRIELFDENNTLLSVQKILQIISEQPENEEIWTKFLVYRDLRNRGLVVRSGFGHGINFRVFPRGAQRDTDTAKFFIVILSEGSSVFLDLFEKVCQQTVKSRKELILAIIDRIGDITYYKLDKTDITKNNK